jgi:hypothetical protein
MEKNYGLKRNKFKLINIPAENCVTKIFMALLTLSEFTERINEMNKSLRLTTIYIDLVNLIERTDPGC